MSATHHAEQPYRPRPSPEIVVLDALGHALRLALAVIRSMNPHLETSRSTSCGHRKKAATMVITHAESLLCALDCYRGVVECEESRRPDDDIPF